MIDEELLEEEFEDTEEELEPSEEEFNPNGKYSKAELEEWTDRFLKEDIARELCVVCLEEDKDNPNNLPYGEETGHVESKLQVDKKGNPQLDEDGHPLYIFFPELCCAKGHVWYRGEGKRRGIRRANPILFESHLIQRKRREIITKEGSPDPAIVSGIYWRSHKQGRKINSVEDRKKQGLGYFR